ncbi:3-hydroxybenzoate 6-hydroxylase [Podospora aff. communis PSN243]|uniref:3-hydroxybenzoate 6-hydroxylase n=1 Tax=Podospora aff. communis PSN243 TaxID=3040156 RepID=A0AAV9GB43_9PEZI|nr:3-hydroxybenzoate 6-hydroxylase [Podospora aff. communis PSN243]
MGSSQQPTAIIIGAGISGLSASIALRRAGFHVTIYEKSLFNNEIGAAISVPPNATRVLDRWGFDVHAHGAVPNEASRFATADDLKVLMYETYEDIGEVMGARSWSFHRVDLHRGLRELAVGEEGVGTPVRIELGREAVGVDCEKGEVRLKDGEVVTGDLVVIADGAHSKLIEDFTGNPSEVARTGRSIYRWLVSMEDVLADPDLAAQYTDRPPGFQSWTDPSNSILWVSYTCRSGKVLNNAVVHPTQPNQSDTNPWHSEAPKSAVLAMLHNFHPSLQKIIHLATEDGIKVHHLFKRPALTSFVHGRALVVGDAAHVMMPTHAAGGAIAIETAATLETLFSGVNPKSDSTAFRKRLELFDRLRIPRCNTTMLASNAGPGWLSVPGVEDEVRRFYGSGPLPPVGSIPWGAAFREFLFHHDAYRAAEEALVEAEGEV